MMRNLVVFVSMSVLFMGCSKSDDDCSYTESTLVAPSTEVANLQTYVNASHPAAVQHSSGLFFEIITPGTGLTPNVCSNVNVKYAGYLTSGFKFDESTTGVTFALGQLIVGWQKGIPLIKAGGRINLYIPPSLGYGSQVVRDGSGNVLIPANSNLVFTIELVSVQ